MNGFFHHAPPSGGSLSAFSLPEPGREGPEWIASLARAFGEDSEEKWGKRVVRAVSDMLLVCDENLDIVYHNRAFLRGIGYAEGTFVKQNLIHFFPLTDREEAYRILHGFLRQRHAGMRVSAGFLTRAGECQFDARITRSRRGDERFHLYFVLRPEARTQEDPVAEVRDDALFDELPVAAFRSDRHLRIEQAFGPLWEQFGFSGEQLVGSSLCDQESGMGPQFLREIDYCDTMAGLTLHTEFEWRGENYEITVEPFLDENRKVAATVGMIRQAKSSPQRGGADHLRFPRPEDYTQALKKMQLDKKTRPVEIGPPAGEKDVEEIRSNIQPRRLSPSDFDHPEEAGDDVALAN